MRIYPPFTIVLVVLFLSVKCYSTQKKEQQINIDSLKIETELTRAYERRYQPDSFFQISQNAFQLSLELENAHLKFKSKLLIALSYLYQNKLEESEKAFDKLAIELKEIKNEQIVIDYYLYYAWFISFKGMVDESIKISHENIKRSEKNGNYKLNLIYDFLSSVEFNAGYYETSLQNKLKARDYTAPSDKKTLMGIDSKIGMLYLDIGITYNAIHYYQSSLKFSEEINVAYIDAYYGLGMCYFSEKEFEKAYSNFKKAVSIAKSKNISTNYYVPINSYLHYWKCSTLLNKPYHKELGDDFILKTKHLLQNERNPSTEILQAEIYIYYNQPDKAEKIMMQNLSSIENLDASSLTADYYYWLAQATEKQKKYKISLNYYQHYKALDDSLKNSRILNKIALLQEQFEATKKEAEIAKLNSQVETEKLNSEISQSRFRNSLIITLSIFIILMVTGLYFRNRQKMKVVSLQAEKESKDHEIQRILEQSKSSILNSNLQGQEKERTRLAKELHDDLGSRLTALSYFVASKKGIFKDDDELLLKTELKGIQKYVRNISHQLAKPQYSKIDLPRLIQEQKYWSNNEKIDFNFVFDPEINWEKVPDQDQNEMYRIVQEAISNALKHSNANNITIETIHSVNKITIHISDNGIGMHDKSGFGLKNMKERAEMIGGNLKIKSRKKSGTQISLLYRITA